MYIEDNTYTSSVFNNAIDCQFSGRYVFRHNTVTDSYVETHGTGGEGRGCRKIEVYANTFTATRSGGETYRLGNFRGSTGVFFDNDVYGQAIWGSGIALDIRRAPGVNPSEGNFGLCDGTNPVDGNQDAYGYQCLDQIGSGRDTTALSWPPSPPPVHTLDPLYFWNNKYRPSNADVPVYVNDSSSANRIHINRDYYVNVGAKPGYTAYTYPHPLSTP